MVLIPSPFLPVPTCRRTRSHASGRGLPASRFLLHGGSPLPLLRHACPKNAPFSRSRFSETLKHNTSDGNIGPRDCPLPAWRTLSLSFLICLFLNGVGMAWDNPGLPLHNLTKTGAPPTKQKAFTPAASSRGTDGSSACQPQGLARTVLNVM